MTAITEKRDKPVESVNSSSDEYVRQAMQGSRSAFREIVLAEHQNLRVYLPRYIFDSDLMEDVASCVIPAFLTTNMNHSAPKRKTGTIPNTGSPFYLRCGF